MRTPLKCQRLVHLSYNVPPLVNNLIPQWNVFAMGTFSCRLWALNFDLSSAQRLMGVILKILPCKVPSNHSLHKDVSQFPDQFSEIYFSVMSIPVELSALFRNLEACVKKQSETF